MLTNGRRGGTPVKAVAAAILAMLVLAGPVQAATEQEPNDIRSQANGPLMAEELWTGDKTSGYDSDWIKFYVAKPNTRVSFDVMRGVLLEHEASFEIVKANGDSVAFGQARLPDGVASGTMSATLAPGKYFVWVIGLSGRWTEGLTWTVKGHGEFATWEEIVSGCQAAEAKLPALEQAVSKAKKALAKAKTLRKGRKAAVKKAKARLAKAKKALSVGKANATTLCGIEE